MATALRSPKRCSLNAQICRSRSFQAKRRERFFCGQKRSRKSSQKNAWTMPSRGQSVEREPFFGSRSRVGLEHVDQLAAKTRMRQLRRAGKCDLRNLERALLEHDAIHA